MSPIINVPGTITDTTPREAETAKRKRGRPRDEVRHAAAADEGVPRRQYVEDQGRSMLFLIWPETRDWPSKVTRELGLLLLASKMLLPSLISALQAREQGNEELASKILTAIARSLTEGSEVEYARTMLCNGWNAQAVATKLRNRRFDYAEGTGPRGSREDKERRVVSALWSLAQERAMAISEPGDDIGELTEQLLFRASLMKAPRNEA